MPLAAGQTLSFYEILGPLGAGGMGEVWRARDTRLEREVAIKVLPEELADDEERLKRFEREAKTLASLNHPNVAGIHGIDQVGDTCFLAMELVPGEDLARRLARGPLSVAEAIDVCRQIAQGLEAAHEAGVVHRDLKPANVRITPEGVVKILDFGLAKPIRPKAGVGGTTAATPDSVLMTQEGLLLGTPTYMSPEQVRGRPIDRRADVWACGCVLYECLCGRRAFGGDSLTDVLAAVLEKEPDLGRLPAETPAHVRRLIRLCLEKDPRRRLRDAGDAWLELGREEEAGGDAPRARRPVAAAAFALGLVVAGTAALLYPRSEPKPPEVVCYALENTRIPIDPFQGLALSPDGTKLVFRARGDGGQEGLNVRSRDALETHALPGTDNGWLPFFAPDGDRVGFFASGKLETVTLSTEIVHRIAELPGGYSGGAWLDDDTLVVTGTNGRRVWRVPVAGGEPEEIHLDLPEEYDTVTSASRVPLDGAFLVALRRGSDAFEAALCTLDGSVTLLAENAFTPTWSASGHVLYQQGQDGPLMALPFDLGRREPTGEAFPVQSGLCTRTSYQVRTFAVADDGTLAYFPVSTYQDEGTLVWVDSKGDETEIEDFGKIIDMPRLSHDGKRIAFRAAAPECNVWVHDLERGVTTRVTHELDNHGIAWSPDDERIACARPGGNGLWEVVAMTRDGAGEPETLIGPEIPRALAAEYSPDGRYLLLVAMSDETNADIEVLDTETHEPRALVKTDAAENEPSFSPDGRYFAYTSDESGIAEVYVLPFLREGLRVQVTTGGGSQPVWSADGRFLFYRHGRQLMRVDVQTAADFRASRPTLALTGDYVERPASWLANYDVSPDGSSFLMIRSSSGQHGATVNVVLNWFQELEAQAPGGGGGKR